MKKLVFTLMLAAVSGAWSEASALCLASVQDNTNQPVVAVGGQITYTGYPCEPDEDCPECLTAALVTDDDKTYYLSGLNEEWGHRLDSIISHPTNAMEYNWPLKAVVSGTTYKQGSFDYIAVGDIRLLSHEEIMLLGKWQIYKETVTNGDGFDGIFTREGQGLHNRYYEFSYSQVYREIYGDYSKKDTFEYTLQPQADGTMLLTVAGLFDMTQQEYPWESGFSPITIHVLSFSEIECEWQSYGGDEGPVIYHQHLNRYSLQADPLPSLCDTWNVLFVRMGGNGDELSTEIHRLTTDTVINGKTYKQLHIYGSYGVPDRVTYRGALREDNNANIYIIPATSDREYLLYAFNAKVGDKLTNLWVGGAAETGGLPEGLNASVTEVTETYPRVFTIYLEEYGPIQWIEGVGLMNGPAGSLCPGILGCGCSCGHLLLCAYKDGEQVYASEESERFGCWYDSSKPTELPSLCDKWNVLHWPFIGDQLKWMNYHLTTDTVINAKRYVKLEIPAEKAYKGALREGNNKDIYIVPADNTQEYLLYSFNAQARDTLNNLWLGETAGFFSGYSGYFGIVANISDSQPRIFTIDIESYDERHTQYVTPIRWIEGVGFESVPEGDWCPAPCAADYGTNEVLCAYKDGEQVYASEEAERFGCWYDSNEQLADTVKMYVQDGPGSSTVEPVDPNQILVTIQDGQLVIREYLDVDLTFTLERIGALHAPARNDATQSDTFHESVTIPLTESGVYQLTLTHPDWGYSIVGTFEYTITGVHDTTTPPAAQKIIHDGRLLIRQGGRTFTLTGVEVK